MEEDNGSDETRGRKAHLNRMGRDEMNLAEFPLAVLADRIPQGCKTLCFEDRIWDGGRRRYVPRRLTISASDKFGLPTALDDEVIFGLVQLSQAEDFVNRYVQFSRYRLVHLLGWRDEGKSYTRLEKSLKRWLGVTLYYENAWWDKCRQKWVDAHFHLLDNLTLYRRSKGGEGSVGGDDSKPLSSFTWNEVVFRSFQAGYLRSIDLEFYRKLKSAVAKRIYRFLDKHFYFPGKRRYKLARFAREHIGLSRNYDAAQLKRRLNPAIKELEEAGYLKPLPADERFVCVRRGEWDIVFVRASKERKGRQPMLALSDLEKSLADRGVSASSAVKLVREHAADYVQAKIAVFDALQKSGDRRVSRNPPGYLVKSIREDYAPPAGLSTRVNAPSSTAPIGSRRVAGRRPQRKPVAAIMSEPDCGIDRYLASLSATERSKLENMAVDGARGLAARGLRRSIESGSEAVADHYRQAIVRQYVERLLNQERTTRDTGPNLHP